MRTNKDILRSTDIAILLKNIEDTKKNASNAKEKYIAQRDYVMISFVAFYGLTIEDIHMIDLEKMYIYPHSYMKLKKRKIDIGNRMKYNFAVLMDDFNEYKKEGNVDGTLFTALAFDFDELIQNYTNGINKEVNFKELRTYCISTLIEHFANLHELKEYLGVKHIDDILPYYAGYGISCTELSEHIFSLAVNLIHVL